MISYKTVTNVPFITKEEMIEVDRLMVEKYKISLIQMMENAGRNLASLSRNLFFNSNVTNKRILVLTGHGANGGGGLVCARHLINWGADVKIIITKNENDFIGVPKHQLDILKNMEASVYQFDNYPKTFNADLIIEALVGYSLSGNPKGVVKEIIDYVNKLSAKKISLDVPAGIDLFAGKVMEPTINADAVLTLALPKRGMEKREIKKQIKSLYLADISVPPSLYKLLLSNLKTEHIFSNSEIVKVW